MGLDMSILCDLVIVTDNLNYCVKHFLRGEFFLLPIKNICSLFGVSYFVLSVRLFEGTRLHDD